MTQKLCNQCKKLFDISNFINEEKEYKRCSKCRKYHKEYSIKYRINNVEKVKQIRKAYRQNNLEKLRKRDREFKRNKRINDPNFKEYQKQYNEKNKEKQKARDKNRMLNTPEYFLFSSARKRARERNLEFSLTQNDVKKLLEKTIECPLRKVKFQRGSNQRAHANSISLDRIDAAKGYTKENIQIISYRANKIKNTTNLEEFRNIIFNFKNYKIIIHNLDNDLTIIKNDRKQILNNKNYLYDKIYRTLHKEQCLIQSARTRNKKSKLQFNIDSNYVLSIWPIDNCCPITGQKFEMISNKPTDNSATIDRIDNNLGYIKGNIQIISLKANSIKNDATIEELEFILKNWEELERNKKC